MTREAIVRAASKMETPHDLLVLLNKIKMDELGDKGYPFTMPQLNYFINPKRNKASYKTFFIPKKSGGMREISAPVRMLKSFQTYVVTGNEPCSDFGKQKCSKIGNNVTVISATSVQCFRQQYCSTGKGSDFYRFIKFSHGLMGCDVAAG